MDSFTTPNRLINGFLNINKPYGISSMEVVRQIKRILLKGQKIGHAGTLDPLAQGVLPICLGQATRLMQYAVEGKKVYCANIQLGYVSETYDAEGPIHQQQLDTSNINIDAIGDALQQFTGTIQQTPPMYSALKVNGQRLYTLARAGLEITRKPRTVQIASIRVERLQDSILTITINCGHGVYIRSLAHDLGQSLGCGAYITNLVRNYSGGFPISESSDLHTITSDPSNLISELHPLDWPIRLLPKSDFSESESLQLTQGRSIAAKSTLNDVPELRAYNNFGQFFGILQNDTYNKVWSPSKMFHLDNSSNR
jgi:tRNA pseudouridine55 synthase